MVEIGMPMLALDQTWSQRRVFHSRNHPTKSTVMDRKFIDEVITAHNHYRACHQAAPLSHLPELSETAQKWAEQLAASNSFQHSNNVQRGERLGENIAMKWSSRADSYTGQEVTDQWYGEVKMYTFGGEPRTLNAGHFTQVVWKGSRQIGVGKAQTRDGKIIVVANYLPAGNMLGDYSRNVLAPKDGKITLPIEKPRSSMTNVFDTGSSNRSDNSNASSRNRRFEDFDDMRRGLFGGAGSISTRGFQSGGESRSTRTYTVTEGHGPNKVTKVIEEETITKADGSKVTNRKETIKKDDKDDNFNNDPFGMVGRSRFGGKFERSEPTTSTNNKTYSNNDASSDPRRKPQKMSEFIDGCVKVHNKLRQKHGVSDVKHSQDLSDYAQDWAEQLARTDGFQHSQCTFKGQRLGENIACKWSSGGGDYSSEEVVEQWYSEISKHDYRSERSLGTGHFTQVVWKDCKEVGIGKAKAAGGKIIVVASYRPAGNMIGSYTKNVFPPK